MNNEKYNQIIDDVYENYSKEYDRDNSIGLSSLVQRVDGKSVYRKPDKQMFISLCTHDKAFSEKWGLKIEERELILTERLSWMKKNRSKVVLPMRDPNVTEFSMDEWFRPYEVPKRAISLTYNNETIEIYE